MPIKSTGFSPNSQCSQSLCATAHRLQYCQTEATIILLSASASASSLACLIFYLMLYSHCNSLLYSFCIFHVPSSVTGVDFRGEWFKVSNLEALYLRRKKTGKETVYVIAYSNICYYGKKIR